MCIEHRMKYKKRESQKVHLAIPIIIISWYNFPISSSNLI